MIIPSEVGAPGAIRFETCDAHAAARSARSSGIECYLDRVAGLLHSEIHFKPELQAKLTGLEWAKLEYSQAFGAHWRATAAFTPIRGDESDFLGQYRHNSHAMLALRYSF